MSLGNNLQYLRQLSGNMTQEELAEKLKSVVVTTSPMTATYLTVLLRLSEEEISAIAVRQLLPISALPAEYLQKAAGLPTEPMSIRMENISRHITFAMTIQDMTED